jgi:hypothetical protein
VRADRAAAVENPTAFHTAARRYCQNRFSDWMENHKQLQEKEGSTILNGGSKRPKGDIVNDFTQDRLERSTMRRDLLLGSFRPADECTDDLHAEAHAEDCGVGVLRREGCACAAR